MVFPPVRKDPKPPPVKPETLPAQLSESDCTGLARSVAQGESRVVELVRSRLPDSLTPGEKVGAERWILENERTVTAKVLASAKRSR
ncbi:MAG: hypothetical protein WA719_09475 [Thermoplasmata archaeon]